MTVLRRRSRRSGAHNRARTGALLLLGIILAVIPLVSGPASADIDLPLLPPLPLPSLPLPLPTSSPTGDPLSETVQGVTDLVTEVPEQLTGTLNEILSGSTGGGSEPAPATAPTQVRSPRVDSWSFDPIPATPQDLMAPQTSSNRIRPPMSYGAAVSGGLRAAGRRAVALAGPLAAPIALAMVALGLLAVAARGPGRLVKVEEERHTFRERHSFKL